jgi:hypothetical protein
MRVCVGVCQKDGDDKGWKGQTIKETNPFSDVGNGSGNTMLIPDKML